MDSEQRILCLAARTELDQVAETELRGALTEPVDWERLWEQGHLHEVIPLVARSLRRLENGVTIPEAWLARARHQSLATLLRNLALADELARVVVAFRDSGVECVPVKGILLAETVYGGLGLRPAIDLDVLVRPRDLPAARRALRELGFFQRRQHSFEAVNHAFHDPPFFLHSGALQVRLELHRGLWAPDQFRPVEGLWERTAEVEFRGQPVRALAPEDMLLHLAIHRSRSALRLRFLCDVAEVLRRYRDVLDWDELIHRAAAVRAQTTLAVSLRLSSDLLGAPVPAERGERLSVGRAKQHVLERTCGVRALFRTAPPDDLDQQPHLMLRAFEQDGSAHIGRALAAGVARKVRKRRFQRRLSRSTPSPG